MTPSQIPLINKNDKTIEPQAEIEDADYKGRDHYDQRLLRALVLPKYLASNIPLASSAPYPQHPICLQLFVNKHPLAMSDAWLR